MMAVSGRYTFLVGLKLAHQLLRCLIVMTGITSSVVLIVKEAKIQLLSSSADDDTHASVEMEAFTVSSWGPDWFAIKLDPSVWIQLLRPSIIHQDTESPWIYKIGVFPDLHCLVGNDSVPIRLGETDFAGEEGTDIKNLDKIGSHPVKIHMRSECLREVISTIAPCYKHVGMMVMKDRVKWHTVAGELTYHVDNGECLTEGMEEGTASCLLMEWRLSAILHFALSQTEEFCTCCSLIHPDWKGWIRFSFLFDGLPFLFLMRGSRVQVNP